MTLRIATLLLALAAAGCNGPFVMFPGGELAGEVAPAPSLPPGDYGTVQLETNPEEPYSVNVAYTMLGDRLYINAGDTETQWVKHMNENPEVRLRIDGVLFAATAERVTDPEEIAAFGQAWTDQSMFRRDPRELEKVWLYRFVTR